MTTISPFAFTLLPAHYDQPKSIQKSPVTIIHDEDSNGQIVNIRITDRRADIRINKAIDGTLVAVINGRPHALGIPNSERHTVNITTGHYNDDITIDDNVMTSVHVKSGSGSDFIKTGGGFANVDAGKGDDQVQLSTGGGHAHGGAGDDKLFGGSGDSRLYGDTGENYFFTDIAAHAPKLTQIYSSGTNDRIRAQAGQVNVTVYSGKPKIDVFPDASVTVDLYSSSGGSEIKIKNSHLRPNNVIIPRLRNTVTIVED